MQVLDSQPCNFGSAEKTEHGKHQRQSRRNRYASELVSSRDWCWGFQLRLQELPAVRHPNRTPLTSLVSLKAVNTYFPFSTSLYIALSYVLNSERVNVEEEVPRYLPLNVMEMSSDPSGPACSLRPEAASSLATINSKQMGKSRSIL